MGTKPWEQQDGKIAVLALKQHYLTKSILSDARLRELERAVWMLEWIGQNSYWTHDAALGAWYSRRDND